MSVAVRLNKEERIARAARMRGLLHDPRFGEVYDLTKAQLERDWLATDPTDSAAREAIYFMLKGLDALCAKMTAVIEDGRVAEQPPPLQPV